MARYILVNIDNGAVLGQTLDSGGMRPFVSIAEAFETLARIESENGENGGEPGTPGGSAKSTRSKDRNRRKCP